MTPYFQQIEQAKRRILEAALREHRGSLTATADALAISQRTMFREIKELGLRELAAGLREKAGIPGRRS